MFQSFLSGADKVTIKVMHGRGICYSDFDGSTFKAGKPDDYPDKISATITFLITDEGAFISHNNGLKKLITLKLGTRSMLHLEHYAEEGATHNWIFHFGQKNPQNKNQFLVTMTRTKDTIFLTQTGMYWGWANIESLK